MSLLVDLQLVPNKILEVVKARILANRAKLTTKQQQVALVKAATRPRPQQQKLNATAVSYRRPEPAAIRVGGVDVAGFTYSFGTNTITIGTKDGRVTKTVPRATGAPVFRKYVDEYVRDRNEVEEASSDEAETTTRTVSGVYKYEVTDYDEYTRLYAFPVSGESCVVLALSYYQSVSIKRNARVTTVSVTEQVPDPCGSIYTKSRRDDTTIEGGELSASESEDRKVYCFLVSAKSISDLPPPQSIIDSIPPRLIDWEESQELQYSDLAYYQSDSEVVAVNACYLWSSRGLMPGQDAYPPPGPEGFSLSPQNTCVTSVSDTEEPGVTLICENFIYGKAQSQFGPLLRLPKISISFLRNRNTNKLPALDDWNPWGQKIAELERLGAPNAFATPGIFGPLNGIVDDPPPGQSGAQIASIYGLEGIAPRISIVAKPIPAQPGTPPTKTRFDIYPGLLPVPTDEDPNSKLRRNTKGVMSINALAVWDWGRPDYCRQRLRQAGFNL